MDAQRVGIALIWLPGSGKSWIWKGLQFAGYHFHDMDNHWLENSIVWYGKWGVARLVQNIGDRAFLEREAEFLMTHYWRMSEWKFFSLENMVFSTSWSVVKVTKSIEYLRDRMHTILIRSSDDDQEEIGRVLSNISTRPDWQGRIVWMNRWVNGEEPESRTLEEELWKRLELYRRYADHVFIHPYTKNKSARVSALEEFITKKWLVSPIQHSA